MAEVGGVQRYIYWSEHRVRTLLEDQGVTIPNQKQRRWATPNFGNIAPVFEQTDQTGMATRPQLAELVEKTIGQTTVVDFDSPAPVKYAKNCSEVVFGEFVVSGASERALMFSTVQTDEGSEVAVCMFGSLANYLDYLADASAPINTGWSSSAAPDVHKFLTGMPVRPSHRDDPEYIAREAVQIGYAQGVHGDDTRSGAFEPWNRAFTFGLSNFAEWFMEVYLDFDFRNTHQGRAYEHDRALIGAPLWVRTPSLQPLQLFDDSSTDPRHRHNKPHRRRSDAH